MNYSKIKMRESSVRAEHLYMLGYWWNLKNSMLQYTYEYFIPALKMVFTRFYHLDRVIFGILSPLVFLVMPILVLFKMKSYKLTAKHAKEKKYDVGYGFYSYIKVDKKIFKKYMIYDTFWECWSFSYSAFEKDFPNFYS